MVFYPFYKEDAPGVHVYLNGRIVPESEAMVPVSDRGLLYGDGVFETMRSYGGELFMAERHMMRLWRSAGLLGIPVPVDEDSMMQAVLDTLEANELLDATVRVTLTRGPGPRGLLPPPEPEPTLVIMAWPFAPYPRELFMTGVETIIAKTRRTPPASLDPRIKSCNYLSNINAKMEAQAANAFEALMLNHEGFLAEGTVCNLFLVRDGQLRTPSLASGILDGITREHVISLARGIGITVVEGMYTPADLYAADEVFLTNTTMEVMPVSRVDDSPFKRGKVTESLMEVYRESIP